MEVPLAVWKVLELAFKGWPAWNRQRLGYPIERTFYVGVGLNLNEVLFGAGPVPNFAPYRDTLPARVVQKAFEYVQVPYAATYHENRFSTITEVRNVAVLKGVVLTEDKGSRQTVRLEARVIEGPSASGVTVQVELRKAATPELLSYRATLELGPKEALPGRHEPARVRKEFSISVGEAYREYMCR